MVDEVEEGVNGGGWRMRECSQRREKGAKIRGFAICGRLGKLGWLFESAGGIGFSDGGSPEDRRGSL